MWEPQKSRIPYIGNIGVIIYIHILYEYYTEMEFIRLITKTTVKNIHIHTVKKNIVINI